MRFLLYYLLEEEKLIYLQSAELHIKMGLGNCQIITVDPYKANISFSHQRNMISNDTLFKRSFQRKLINNKILVWHEDRPEGWI